MYNKRQTDAENGGKEPLASNQVVGGSNPSGRANLITHLARFRKCESSHKIKNINKVLVKARAGNAMLNRRRGLIYTKSELKLMKNIYKIGLTKNPFYFFYFSARGIARLLPAGALQIIYKKNRK